MATAFTRTLRSIRADSYRGSLVTLLLATLLLGAWSVWIFFGEVTRYETPDSARLEVAQSAYVLQAPLSGKVVSNHLDLGREVRAGDVLVELDTSRELLLIKEQRARRAVLEPQLDSLRAELAAAVQAGSRENDATQATIREARARVEEAELSARFAEGERTRMQQLFESGLTAERDYEQARSEANRTRAAVETLRQALPRLAQEQLTRESDRKAEILRLESEIKRLEGEQTTSSAAVTTLQNDVEQHFIRAPVSGRLGEVATLHAGSVLEDGDRLATIVPTGTLRIVADFPPAAAIGRIAPGQSARMRVEGFPWTQYGTFAARVATVAGEVRNGTVRVEFDILSDSTPPIPAQHGLAGTIEVDVERVSPAMLALRAAGGLFTAPQSVFDSRSN